MNGSYSILNLLFIQHIHTFSDIYHNKKQMFYLFSCQILVYNGILYIGIGGKSIMAKFKYSGVFIRNKTDKQSVEQNAKGVMTQLYNIITSMKGDLANKILY